MCEWNWSYISRLGSPQKNKTPNCLPLIVISSYYLSSLRRGVYKLAFRDFASVQERGKEGDRWQPCRPSSCWTNAESDNPCWNFVNPVPAASPANNANHRARKFRRQPALVSLNAWQRRGERGTTSPCPFSSKSAKFLLKYMIITISRIITKQRIFTRESWIQLSSYFNKFHMTTAEDSWRDRNCESVINIGTREHRLQYIQHSRLRILSFNPNKDIAFARTNPRYSTL